MSRDEVSLQRYFHMVLFVEFLKWAGFHLPDCFFLFYIRKLLLLFFFFFFCFHDGKIFFVDYAVMIYIK